jgi:uncharacterized protein YjbI with pentapeptide repeats
MKVVNNTRMTLGTVASRMNFPGHTLTLVVKATYRLVPGGVAVPHESPLFPDGDTLFPDDTEGTGSIRCESDFAPIKPRSDLMLVGHAWAPEGGKGVASMSVHVKFSVGETGRSLLVVGDRHTKPGETNPSTTPFLSMPLTYERAFGGPRYKPNPVGTGHRAQDDEETGERVVRWPNLFDIRDEVGFVPSSLRPKPQVVTPQAGTAESNVADSSAATAAATPMPSPSERVDPYSPAGFGPIRRDWHARASKLGTYDSNWVAARFPAVAADFDPSHFNAASPDLQRDGYLIGTEEVRMENLHATIADYRSRLPGLRVRAFRNDLPPADSLATPRVGTAHEIASLGAFSEVPLNLDTVWVDADAELITLTWRGWCVVSDEDFDEIAHIYLMTEQIGGRGMSIEECRNEFLLTIKAEETPFNPETPADEPATHEEAKKEETPLDPAIKAAVEAELAKSDAPPEVKAEVLKILTGSEEEIMARVKREAREALQKAGVDPDNMPPLTPEQLAKKIELLKEWGVNPEEVLAAEAMAGSSFLAQAAPKPKPPQSPTPAEQRAEFERALVAAGFDARTRSLAMDFFDLDPHEKEARLARDMRLIYRQQNLDPDNPPKLSAEDEQRKFEALKAWGVDPEWVRLAERAEEESRLEKRKLYADTNQMTRERVLARLKAGESLAGERLAGIDLSDADLTGADFEGADLQDATLRGTLLAGAILSRANLARADLSNADLSQADASNADFSRANLEGAKAIGAGLEAAIFVDATLRGAVFDGAMAGSAGFTRVEAAGLSAVGADFTGAEFSNAVLTNANLAEADFSRAGLMRANLRHATMTDTRLAGADATNADFSEATITNLRASGGPNTASVFRDAKFYHAQGAGTKWRGCDLRGVDFRYARIPGADFTKAILDDADLSACDIPGGTFRKAKLRRTKMISMNLFNGSMEKADFVGADLRGSNMYGVEFLEANAGDNEYEGVNLKMTKLAKASPT